MKKSEKTLINYRSGEPKWVTWSMEPHTEDEIRNAYLYTPELICTSYLCRYSKMSEKFIEEELIILSTGVFSYNPDYYTKRNREFVKEILFIEPTSARPEVVNSYKKKRVSKEFLSYLKENHKQNIRSKVDWWQIANYQVLSDEFKAKFERQFNECKVKSDAEFVK